MTEITSTIIDAVAPRIPRLSIVARSYQNFAVGPQTIGTAGNWNTARVQYTNLTGKVVKDLQPVFCNYGPSSARERANANPIQVKAAIEFNGTTTDQTPPRAGLMPYGQQVVTLGAVAPGTGGVVVMPPAHGTLSVGAPFYERTSVTVGTANQIVQIGGAIRGGTTAWGVDNGEGYQSNSGAERAFDGGDIVISNVNGAYTSSLILGTLADGSASKSIVSFNDSIGAGVDDAGFAQAAGGWIHRAFAAVPGACLGFPGEKLSDAVIRANNTSRLLLSQYATHILIALGRNDIGAGQTAATINANLVSFASYFASRGQTVIVATILPAPTTTDGGATVANQTKETTEAVRVAVNQFIRATDSTGLVAQVLAAVPGSNIRTVNACAGIEVNAQGALTVDGGFVLPATVVSDTGTSSGSNTTLLLNDTTKAWAINAHRGKQLYIVSGTGAGQSRAIGWNTATQLGVGQAFTTTPDATSVYRIDDSTGFFGVHYGTQGHIRVANGINVSAVMA